MGVASYTLSTNCNADDRQFKILFFPQLNLYKAFRHSQSQLNCLSPAPKRSQQHIQEKQEFTVKSKYYNIQNCLGKTFKVPILGYLKEKKKGREGGREGGKQKGFTYVSLAMIFLPIAAWMAISNNCLGIASFKRSHKSLPVAYALSLKKKVTSVFRKSYNPQNISTDQTDKRILIEVFLFLTQKIKLMRS